jgi:hypothetical protein
MTSLLFLLLLPLFDTSTALLLPVRPSIGAVPSRPWVHTYSTATNDEAVSFEDDLGIMKNPVMPLQEKEVPEVVMDTTAVLPVHQSKQAATRPPLGMLQDASKWVTSINRPKMIRMSGHSALGSIATLSFFVAVMPHLSLGYHTSGFPQVFDMSSFDDPVLAKSVGFMFALTSMAGLTRIPKNSSKLRRVMFETSACMSLLLYTIQDSNLGMLNGGWSLDLLLDGPAWLFTWLIYGCTVFKSLQFLEESIAAPNKGRDTLPFNGSRIGMATIASSMVALLFLNGPIIPACFFDHNREAFEALCLPGLSYFGGWHTSGYFVVEAYIGFGMLISTLLFERKINQTQASIFMGANFVLSGLYDAAQFFFQIGDAPLPGSLLTLIDYGQGVMEKFSIYEIGICLWTFAFVKTMMRVQEQEKNQQAAKLLVAVHIDQSEESTRSD